MIAPQLPGKGSFHMTKKIKKTKKRKLSTKLLLGVVLFALIIMICTSIAVGYYYFSAELAESKEYAFAMARAGARMVNGDRVRDYLTVTGTNADGSPVYYTDDYYYEVLDFLNAVQEENDLVMYYYICVPQGGDMTYIWDAVTAEEPSPQGFTEPLLPKEKKCAELAFSRDPEEKIAPLLNSGWGNLLVAFSPIFDSSGEPVALVGVDLSMNELLVKFNVYLLLILASILVVTAVGVLFLFKNIRETVIKPIGELNRASKSIVGELSGKTRFDLEIHTGDELEELADSFRKMDDDLHEYINQLTTVTADRERIHAELGIAKQIQADILPNEFPAFPERNDFDIYAALCPCEKIGGDFYDFFLVDDDHLAMLVGDVSGLGVPAALYMVMVETLIKNRAMQSFTPADVLQSVSEQMLAYKTELTASVWFAVLELSSGKGIAVNAGFSYPALHRAGGRFEMLDYENFPAVGSPDGVRFRNHGFVLEPGDSLFLFSDGVRNACGRKGESFGDHRVLEILNREPEATPSVLIQMVRHDVERYLDGEPQDDDLTMFSMKYYGSSENTKRYLDSI